MIMLNFGTNEALILLQPAPVANSLRSVTAAWLKQVLCSRQQSKHHCQL